MRDYKDKPQTEKIFENQISDFGLLSRICKELFTSKKYKIQPNIKNGWSNRLFSKEYMLIKKQMKSEKHQSRKKKKDARHH